MRWFIASATIAGEIGQAQSQTDQAGGIALQAETRLANEEAPINFRNSGLDLHSSSAIVVDQKTGRTLFGKNTDARMPIASITKLMTAMVVLDAQLPLDEKLPSAAKTGTR